RRDGVDADSVRPELPGQRPGQADEAGLGRTVGGRLRHADLAKTRRDVDDRPAATLEHGWQHSAAGVEGRGQVHPDDLVPFGGLDLEEGADLRAPGIVDERVHAPETIDHALDELL